MPQDVSGNGPVTYAAYFLLLMALGGLAEGLTNLIDSTDSDNTQPSHLNISAMTVNMTADFAALAEAIVTAKKNCEAAQNLVSAANTDTVKADRGLWIRQAFYLVETSTLLMGFGSPYTGEDLAEGAKQLAAISDQLNSAFPDDSWQGLSAQAYVDRVATVQQSLDVLAYTDQWLMEIAAETAYFVNCIRLICGCLKLALAVAYVLIRYCNSSGDIKTAASWDWNICRGVGVVMSLLTLLVQVQSIHIKSYCLQPIAEDYRSFCNW